MCLGLEMLSLLCRGCTAKLPTPNSGVDIFAQETSSRLLENSNIRTGIELITGLSVSAADGLPRRLCTVCSGKLKEFLAFRAQLLTSLEVFVGSSYSRARSSHHVETHCQLITTLGHGTVDNLMLEPQPLLGVARLHSNGAVPAPQLNNEPENQFSGSRVNIFDDDDESEIDVCSGEDHEILELDVQSKKDEIYEVESSEESDVQVCDHEPALL